MFRASKQQKDVEWMSKTKKGSVLMQYEYLEERIMMSKCGDLKAFEGLILEGCGSLYLYAAMIKNTKNERIRLVRNTYMTAWNRLQMLEIPGRFDLWIKGILWKQAAIECHEEEEVIQKIAEDGVSNLIREAFKSSENYWYLPLDDKYSLAETVISDIQSGASRMIS